MDTARNSNNLGEVSFSCYLGTAKEKFIQKITESVQYPHHSITSSPDFPSSISLERSKSGEGEIGVFEAQKYYNMRLDDGPIIIDTATTPGNRKANQVELLRVKTKSRPGTPSVSSEASWNSQTTLLPSYQRSLPRAQNKPKRVHVKSNFFAGLSCHGSCNDKKSVYVSPNVEHVEAVRGREHKRESTQTVHSPIMLDGRKLQPRLKVKDDFHKPTYEKMSTTTSMESNKEELVAIAVANPSVQNLAIKRQLAKEKIIEEESRKSLEVFGSHTLNKEVIEMNLERKLSMLSWDAIPKTPKLPTSSVRSQVYEDIESDASSDLFELGNISGSGEALFTRGTSDGVPGCMSPTPYAPSETSIEWSVVTASAADFSAISDYDEKKLTENFNASPGASKVAQTKSMVKDAQSGRSSKLLGCKSHKAVRVAENAYRTSEKAKFHPQQPQRSVTHMPGRKLQADIDERF
ncbi:hypothetical protein Pint_15213 [Pistacia integerrima]|uniref:Uncharacterized protein n=1 Tax=Pistacia integerrima TaxID=434235 RepID=A0ACC0ZFT1_9ROSI|nr:hypothetical protein Pint_15213 [Pistacia integerrima]